MLGQVDRIGRPVDVANASWIRQALATDLMYPIGLHVSGGGDVFVTGFLLDHADFGGAIMESERSRGFSARYGPDGELRWARPGSVPTGLPWLSVHAVATHGDRIYASEGEVPGSTHRDWYDAGGILVTEFSPMGDSLRSLVVGGRNAASHWMSYIHGLGTDRAGNLYIGGAYGDTLTLHPDVVLAPMDTNKYNADLFLASYTPEWELRWGRQDHGPVGL